MSGTNPEVLIKGGGGTSYIEFNLNNESGEVNSQFRSGGSQWNKYFLLTQQGVDKGLVAGLHDISTMRISIYEELIELFPDKKEQFKKMIKVQELELNKKE